MSLEKTETAKTPSSSLTLIIVLIVAFLYPTALYSLRSLANLTNPTTLYFLTIFSAIVLGGTAIWGLKRDGISKEELGLNLRKYLQAVILLGITWILFAVFYLLTAGYLDFNPYFNLAEVVQQWLLVAMAEELLFRGYLLNRFMHSFQNLPSTWTAISAVTLTSAIFAAYHLPVRLFNHFTFAQTLISMALLFLIGLINATIFLRTRNLVFTGLVHGSWNVPPFGTQGDFIIVILYAIVIEAARFIQTRRNKPISLDKASSIIPEPPDRQP